MAPLGRGVEEGALPQRTRDGVLCTGPGAFAHPSPSHCGQALPPKGSWGGKPETPPLPRRCTSWQEGLHSGPGICIPVKVQ